MQKNLSFTVVQCWDDGVTTDARLVTILRRFNAKATFNLSAGLHSNTRAFGWMHAGTEVERLAWDEMKAIYEGFTIANHSLTHPRLDLMDTEAARREIVEGRDRLQQLFGQPILGFAYPFGTYTKETMDLVQEAGHVYARTGDRLDCAFPPENVFAFNPYCHFLAPDFWERYAKAKTFGLFYFWGHSYEMVSDEMWSSFESMIHRISDDPDAIWGDLPELF